MLHSDGSHIFTLFLGYRIQKSQLFTTLKSKPNNLEDGGLHTETHKLGNAINTGAHNNQPQLQSEVMAPEFAQAAH